MFSESLRKIYAFFLNTKSIFQLFIQDIFAWYNIWYNFTITQGNINLPLKK